MTQAVCICCGEFRFGAFTKCRMCGYEPETNWEFGASVILSDQKLDLGSLRTLSQLINQHYLRGEAKSLNFDVGAHQYITQMFDDPGYRDMFTLSRPARDGLFSRQMNWHSEGPDGYSVAVVTRGKDLPKAEFDALAAQGGKNAFFIETYTGGRKASSQVPKTVWYCLKDTYKLLERRITDQTKSQRYLSRECALFTVGYLKARHQIDMTSTVFG